MTPVRPRVPPAAAAALMVLALPAAAGAKTATAPAAHGAARAAATVTGGTLRAWGLDSRGQLGNGTQTLSSLVPVKVTLPSGTRITQVRAGSDFTVALTSTGQVLAWGDNSFGQLGIGRAGGVFTTPRFVHLPTGVTVTAVRAGGFHALALTSTGQVLAWGDNSSGQVGDPSGMEAAPVQVALPAGDTVKAISAGTVHSLALTSSGQVFAWGDNTGGQLGNGTTGGISSRPVPVTLPAGVTVTGLAASFIDSYAVTGTGAVLAWGDNSAGQLGDNRAESRSATPVFAQLPAGVKVRGVAGGSEHALALTSTGHVLAWGDNLNGEVGDGTHTERDVPTPITLPGGATAKALSAGAFHSLALTTAGTVLAWGQGGDGELGNGSVADSVTPVRTLIPAGLAVTAVAAGPSADHSLAIVHKVA